MSYKETELYKMLRRVLKDPIVILVKGDWRAGKTNNALLIAYLCLKWGLVETVGSNIHTRGVNANKVDFVEETGKLKDWMHKDHKEKLFILDEALKTVYRRKAMSKLSIKIITDILPEVSKGHTRLLLLSQIEKLDTDVLHPAFHRATWECEEKGTMLCRSKHYPTREFFDLPKSPIDYDPDTLARFIDKDTAKVGDSRTLPLIFQVCELYAKGWAFHKIADELSLHKQQVKRMVIKGVKYFVDNHEEASKLLEEGENVNAQDGHSLIE